MIHTPLRKAALVVVLSLAAAAAAIAGPPWISIEYPVNPHDPNTRNAYLTVRVYHHGDLVNNDIGGTAEGLVDGKRQSVKLDIKRLPQTGVYAVYWKKPASGHWALLISTSNEGHFLASALVDIDDHGRIASVSVPSDPIEGGRWRVPRRIASNELENALRGNQALSLRR